MKKATYRKEYIDEMLSYFSFSEEGETGLPSFVKFASKIGVRSADLAVFRETHPAFRAAYEECKARLRDHLIDGVLSKKYDASFVKLLLQEDIRDNRDETPTGYEIVFRIEDDIGTV